MVVLFTQMAEPHVLQPFRHIFCQCPATRIIRQVTTLTLNTLFQIGRIRSVSQHLHIVIGLNHQIVGVRDGLLDVVGDAAHIGDDHKVHTFHMDLIAHILRSVVRHHKRAHQKLAYLHFLTHRQHHLHIIGHLPRNAIVMVDTRMNLRCGIDGQRVVMTKRPHRLDMVRMIVRNQHMLHITKANAIVPTVFFKGAQANANIYHQSVCGGTEVVAVSTASASKRYKFQHFN